MRFSSKCDAVYAMNTKWCYLKLMRTFNSVASSVISNLSGRYTDPADKNCVEVFGGNLYDSKRDAQHINKEETKIRSKTKRLTGKCDACSNLKRRTSVPSSRVTHNSE